MRLAPGPSAAYFNSPWNLPESVKLETQMLDKLSLAPARLLGANTNLAATNQSQLLLRPLVDDLLREESYAEVGQTGDFSREFALAIKLNDQHAALWETNLAAAVQSLTGVSPAWSADGQAQVGTNAPPPAAGYRWRFEITDHRSPASATNNLELARVGDWTAFGLSRRTNGIFADVVARIRRSHAPFAPRQTNFWLEADLDLSAVATMLLPSAPGAVAATNAPLAPLQSAASTSPFMADLHSLPIISLSVIGDGQAVRTRGKLNFSEPLLFELEKWNVPTNLIRDPISAFSAVQGVAPNLASLSVWKDLQLGPPPNQLFFWAQGKPHLATFFAAPLPGASNWIHHLTELALQKGNPWTISNDCGIFNQLTNANGIMWNAKAPFLEPALRSWVDNQGEFIFAGLGAALITNRAPPIELLRELSGRKDLVAYDWELTGMRLEAALYISQFLRFTLHKAQVPVGSNYVEWLRALEPKLGNCVTEVTRTAPQQLSFIRSSTFGLTSGEFQLLLDWLASPEFPRGLNTFVGSPGVLLARKTRAQRTTNSPPARSK